MKRVTRKFFPEDSLFMSFRPRISLLVSFVLSAGFVFAQQSPPAAPAAPSTSSTPATPAPPARAFGEGFSFFVDGGSFLGVHAEDIDKEKSTRYGLRDVRGVGITSVVKDSPAEKAGLRKDDVILRFDGENVTSVRKLNRLVSEVAPDQSVRLVISRGGAEQDVAVTVGKRTNTYTNSLDNFMKLPGAEVWGHGIGKDGKDFSYSFGNNRRVGISTTPLTKQLAEYFGIAEGTGVLVTAVTDDSPAAKAGIKAGDIITAVDGEKIEGSGDLSRAINKKKEGDVTLTLVRNKNQRNVTVTPKEGPRTILAPGQVGTRVIMPRIEIPEMPEINIRTPRIEIPAIPSINIDLGDRIRRGKLESRPI